MEGFEFLGQVEEFLKSDKPFTRAKLPKLQSLLRKLDKYQDLLIELINTTRAMRVVLQGKIKNLEERG